MDLQLTFDSWQPEDPAFESRLRAATSVRTTSQHPLEKLRRSMLANLIFAGVITLGYLVLFPFLPHPVVMFFLGLVVVYNLWAMANTYTHYKRMPTAVSAMNDVLAELKAQVALTSGWMRLHIRSGLFMYPLAITGGFLFGGLVGSGAPPAELMAKPAIWWVLGITLVVMVPICHYTVKWMTHAAFGVHVEAMRRSIAELEG